MILRILIIITVAAVLTGCSQPSTKVLGADLGSATPVAIRDVKSGAPVTVAGTMIEKCPTAGCWFMLKDSTGVIRVDTKTANFTVTDLAVNTPVTVRGSLKEGADRMLTATGLRF